MRETFGCGFDGFAGRGADRRFPQVATCPEYLVRTAWIGSCYEYIGAYRSGNLGSVFDLPHPLFEALLVLDAELKAHEAELTKQVQAD